MKAIPVGNWRKQNTILYIHTENTHRHGVKHEKIAVVGSWGHFFGNLTK